MLLLRLPLRPHSRTASIKPHHRSGNVRRCFPTSGRLTVDNRTVESSSNWPLGPFQHEEARRFSNFRPTNFCPTVVHRLIYSGWRLTEKTKDRRALGGVRTPVFVPAFESILHGTFVGALHLERRLTAGFGCKLPSEKQYLRRNSRGVKPNPGNSACTRGTLH